jgi:hypothetical protein
VPFEKRNIAGRHLNITGDRRHGYATEVGLCVRWRELQDDRDHGGRDETLHLAHRKPPFNGGIAVLLFLKRDPAGEFARLGME